LPLPPEHDRLHRNTLDHPQTLGRGVPWNAQRMLEVPADHERLGVAKPANFAPRPAGASSELQRGQEPLPSPQEAELPCQERHPQTDDRLGRVAAQSLGWTDLDVGSVVDELCTGVHEGRGQVGVLDSHAPRVDRKHGGQPTVPRMRRSFDCFRHRRHSSQVGRRGYKRDAYVFVTTIQLVAGGPASSDMVRIDWLFFLF
jgi:hypothetical protein